MQCRFHRLTILSAFCALLKVLRIFRTFLIDPAMKVTKRKMTRSMSSSRFWNEGHFNTILHSFGAYPRFTLSWNILSIIGIIVFFVCCNYTNIYEWHVLSSSPAVLYDLYPIYFFRYANVGLFVTSTFDVHPAK